MGNSVIGFFSTIKFIKYILMSLKDKYIKYILKMVYFGSKGCTKELKLEKIVNPQVNMLYIDSILQGSYADGWQISVIYFPPFINFMPP